MTIDMSPMSTFLTIALFLIGTPAVILSVVVWLKITRSFFNERDYEEEVLPDTDKTAPFPGKTEHGAGRQSSGGRDALSERMIQSG